MRRILIFVLLLALAGCSKLGVGYRVTLAVRNAADATSQALAVVCQEKRIACQRAHPLRTSQYAGCMANCIKALTAWVQVVKPAVNSALRASWGVLEAARLRGELKAKWINALKPGACMLMRSVTVDWKHLLGKHTMKILPYLKAAEGMVCP